MTLFRGFRFPPEVILWAVRWYLRFAVSFRDLEEMLAECGVRVDHWRCPLNDAHWAGIYALPSHARAEGLRRR